MTNHLFSLIRDGVPDPAKTVIETPDGRRTTYADLIARSGAYAAALRAAGVAPGDRVAVQVEKSPEVIFLYLGVVRAGAVFLPLNTAYTPAEIAYFLGDAEPAVFVCDPGKRAALAEAASRRPRGLDPRRRGRRQRRRGRGPAGAADVRRRGPGSAGSRGDPLHLGHDRALQGRHADPRQPRVERPRPWWSPGASPPTTC